MIRSLRTQLLVLALMPSLSIALLMGLYLSWQRSQDIEQLAAARADALFNQLQATATHTPEKLQALSNALLEESGLRSVSVFAADRTLLAHAGMPIEKRLGAGHFSDNNTIQKQLGDLLVFTRPLRHTNSTEKTPRWMTVTYQHDIFIVKHYRDLVNQNSILFGLLLAAGLFGFWLSRRLSADIKQLSNTVKRIGEGDNAQTTDIHSCRELAQLADNIQVMAADTRQAFDELRQNVDITTSDLKETIETIEIQNIELTLAQKEALAASRAKSEFLANTSHEIRTPLNGIIGFGRLLQRSPLNARQAEYLETIIQSSQGLLTIINDILDFSKMEAGKLSLDETPFNLKQICEEVICLFAPAAYEKNLELVLLVYQDVPAHLIGDPTRIKQLLSNLVSNAVKFTDCGTITIRVALQSHSNDRFVVAFSVSDTGIGMNTEQQQTLFKAFAQGNASIARKYGGTGLGLAIIKKLADLMQGDIHVESDEGYGSTFTFSVPLKPVDRQQETADSDMQGKAVLLIEPHELACTALRHMLESRGMHVNTADSIDQAQSVLALHHVNAIINSMPAGNDNNRFIQQSYKLQQQTDLPVLLLMPPTENSLPPLPKHKHIAISFKPVTEPRLFTSLARLLQTPLAAPAQASASRAGTLHILAVDDQPANLRLLQVLLEDNNITVTAARDGASAVDAACKQAFDLILMDIQMPGMDGIQTAETIRQTCERNNATPVIAITAHALEEEKQALLAQGFRDYLAKPVDEWQLLAVIDKWADPAANGLATVDIALCLRLANGKTQLACDMFNMLADDLEDDIEKIKAMHQSADTKALLEAVHRLHGACCYTGVPALKNAALNCERMLKKDQALSPALLDELLAAADAVIQWQQSNNFAGLVAGSQL